MTENSDELFAERSRGPLVEQVGLDRVHPVEDTQVVADDLREHLEHRHRFGRVQAARLGVNRAKRAKERTVAKLNRHRYVALQSIKLRRVVFGINRVSGRMVDDDGPAGLPNFMTKGGLDLELVTWLQPKGNVVTDTAGNPLVLSHPGNRRKSHAGARQTTSSIVGMAFMLLTAARSSARRSIIPEA